jgi:hypothetical protein
MSQDVSTLWNDLQPFILLISALGALLTALFTGLLFWTRHELPADFAEVKSNSQPSEPDLVTRHVEFNLEFDRMTATVIHSKWVVDEISITYPRHKWIAVAGGSRMNEVGERIYSCGGYWTDRIPYYPPVAGGVFLLHPDAPDYLKLSFRLRLKSCHRVKRKVDVTL